MPPVLSDQLYQLLKFTFARLQDHRGRASSTAAFESQGRLHYLPPVAQPSDHTGQWGHGGIEEDFGELLGAGHLPDGSNLYPVVAGGEFGNRIGQSAMLLRGRVGATEHENHVCRNETGGPDLLPGDQQTVVLHDRAGPHRRQI